MNPPARLLGRDQVAAAVARWRATHPRALGMWLEVDLPPARHLEDDPRVGRIVTLAVALGAGEVAVIDEASADAVEPLLAWLESPDDAPYVAFADAHPALARLRRLRGRPFEPPRLGSVQAAAALLAEGTRHARDLPAFEPLAAQLLGRPLPPIALERRDVGGEHARAVLECLEVLTPLLRKRDLVPPYQLECQVLPAVVAMEAAGLGVDAAAFARVVDGWQAERAETTEPERIARLDKLISTYGYWPREYIRQGRIHARLHPLAADSGRFSCTEPNLQQVPSEHTAPGLRACFVPPPGFALVVADYAQIELRVAAHLAGCAALRRVFVESRDPHRATAASITRRPEATVTDHERKLAKAVNFGFLFGMGARRFREYASTGYGVEVSAREAQAARQAFLRTYPGIATWHERVSAMQRTGQAVTVRTALGRRKRFAPGEFSFNAALNIPVQGTAAEGFKRALVALHLRLQGLGGRGVLCVHDEYIAEVPIERAAEAKSLVAEVMRDEMASIVSSVPIVVEARVARTWAEKP